MTQHPAPSQNAPNRYTQVLGISTIAAVVTAAVALLMMNFGRNERSVQESGSWLKRIIIGVCANGAVARLLLDRVRRGQPKLKEWRIVSIARSLRGGSGTISHKVFD